MQEDTQAALTARVIKRFNEAFNRHDVQAIMALMTDDCVFENTYPSPDGERFEGQKAVGHFWEEFFHASPQAVFQLEEMFTHGDRGVTRWRFDWIDTNNQSGHVRGVDVLRVRNGKIAEKFSYVKG